MPATVTASNQSQNQNRRAPGVIRAMVRGSIGFALVSLAGFSVWAFGGKWLQTHFGEAGLYSACAIVFICASGLFLASLMTGPGSLRRFYAIFIPAFLAYAVVWCAAWFVLHFGLGEWLGSLLGTSAFASIMAWRFRNTSGIGKTIVILFGCHTAGYFLGGHLMQWVAGAKGPAMFASLSKHQIGVLAKLSWGLLYGLGFGAGIGYALHQLQREDAPVSSPERADVSATP